MKAGRTTLTTLHDVTILGLDGTRVQLAELMLFEKPRRFIVLYKFGNPFTHSHPEGGATSECKGRMEVPIDEWLTIRQEGIDSISGRVGSVSVLLEGIRVSGERLGSAASVRFVVGKCTKRLQQDPATNLGAS